MHIFTKSAGQGDVLFIRRDSIPAAYSVELKMPGPIVVAHSETGHNHEIETPEVRMFERLERNPLVCYLSVEGYHCDIVHKRSFDTHGTIRISQGIWEVRRQRENTPQGWRRVED
jgi:hypothetical protein